MRSTEKQDIACKKEQGRSLVKEPCFSEAGTIARNMLSVDRRQAPLLDIFFLAKY